MKTIKLSLTLLLLLLSSGVSAETLYVSDELRVAVRSGDTTGHRIIKFIRSGTRLEVLDTNDAGTFKLVRIDGGVEGWVSVDELSETPAAREQIAALNTRVSDLRKNLRARETELKTRSGELAEARQQISDLEQQVADKTREQQELERIAARPVQLAREKQQLELELQNAIYERDSTRIENEQLSDDSIKEWFMIGAGVSIGSLILGLIIPSIRWKKKSSWGSDF